MNIIFVSFFDLKRLVDANVNGFASSVLGNAPNTDDTGLFFSGEITATALVAFAALVLSVINLCWTVFRDTRRSKLRVRASVMRIAYPDGTTSEQFISISITNFGPVANRGSLPVIRMSFWNRWVMRVEWPYAVIQPDYAHPSATPVNETLKLLEVGGETTFCVPYNANCFLNDGRFVQLRVDDVFGKSHYMSKKNFRKLRQRFLEDFQEQSESN